MCSERRKEDSKHIRRKVGICEYTLDAETEDDRPSIQQNLFYLVLIIADFRYLYVCWCYFLSTAWLWIYLVITSPFCISILSIHYCSWTAGQVGGLSITSSIALQLLDASARWRLLAAAPAFPKLNINRFFSVHPFNKSELWSYVGLARTSQSPLKKKWNRFAACVFFNSSDEAVVQQLPNPDIILMNIHSILFF